MKSNKQGLKQQSLSCSQNAASLALEFPLLALIHLLTTASALALLGRRNEELWGF